MPLVKRGTYQVYQRADGLYDYRLVATNGEVLFNSSQGYTSVKDARRGIAAARRNALIARVHPRVLTEDEL